MENFRKLGLSEQLLELLKKANISEPSKIQEKVIPLIMAGRDVIGGSATGSGKTIAFGAGIIEKVILGKGLQVLILVPTRELAEQVGDVFSKFSSYKRINVAKVYGGVGIEGQVKHLRNSEIAVGTPGRLLDHIGRGTIRLSGIKMLVLDEADRMLDMGFIDDVERIIRECPKDRQTLLFSATISADIEALAGRYLRNPEYVAVESYVDAGKLHQIYYDVSKNLKFSLLVHLLQKEKYGLVMVFCNTRHNADFIGKNLEKVGIETLVIHGGLTQQRRNKIMERFNENKVYVLVCTDIAARGLDIKGISHVYNYDLPKSSKDYVHRIGRTARAGKDGIAISLVSDRDYENFRAVLSDESLSIEQTPIPDVKMIPIEMDKRRMHGGSNAFSRGPRRDRREIRPSGSRGGGSSGRSSFGRSSGRSFGGRDDRSGGRRDDRRGGSGRNNSRSSRNSFRGNQSRGRGRY